MAVTNGVTPSLPNSTTPLPNTGKRKRSDSLDGQNHTNNHITKLEQEDGVQQSLRDILQLLRKTDLTPSILKHPLPSTSADEPVHKRVRLISDDQHRVSIESQIESQAYSSFEELIRDIDLVSSSIVEELEDIPRSKARSQILVFRQSLDRLLRKEVLRGSVVKDEDDKDNGTLIPGVFDNDRQHERGLVLTLSSVTEKGPKPLYSGLQGTARPRHAANTADAKSPELLAPLDAKSLPNGMTVIDPGVLHAHRKAREAKDTRTVGDVFQPHRSLKPLEVPQPSRSGKRDSKLEFVSRTSIGFLDHATPTYKSDYKFAALPTGEWLEYNGTTSSQYGSKAKKRQRDQALGNVENQTISSHNEILEHDDAETKSLFQAAYSSFAPTVDNSVAIIPASTRGQLWWERVGRRRFDSLFSSILYPVADLDGDSSVANQESSEQFEDVVQNFEPEDGPFSELGNGTHAVGGSHRDTDELLTEISELLEVLSSHQKIRNLALTPRPDATEPTKGTTVSTTPSDAEYDIYEILRSQLALLIDSLPPFAIAKLNGDQLELLNIGTRLVVENYDYAGSMEPDEHTLQRRRAAAAAAAAAASRTAAVPAARPGTYQTPSATTSYNRGAYGSNSARQPYQQSSRPPYGTASTPAATYQTPRPPSSSSQRPGYPQQYQSTTTSAYSQGPNVQQFQRPMQNGYGSYSGTPSQPGYAQRPTQPGYQQRAQENAQNYARSASPTKPVTNGQPPYYPPRPLPTPQSTYSVPRANSASYSVSEQQAAIERTKLAQQQHLQRQSSGTPQSPAYGYEGASERRETSNGAPVAAGSE